MNYIKSALLISFCVLLVSCGGGNTKNETILRAESLLFSSPDSAYRLLSSIPHPEKLSKADYAAWCLNYTHARYKTDRDIKSDSIIMDIAVDYYRHTNLFKQSGTAWYLSGCISESNKKKQEALLAFKKADEILQNTTENNLKGFVKFNIGHLYMRDEVYSQSLIYFKECLPYFIASKNRKYQAYAYREISDMFFRLNYPFKAVMKYSDLALKLSKQAGDSLNYYSILAQQAMLLIDKDYVRAKENLLKSLRYPSSEKPNFSALLSYLYTRLNKLDSAKYYLQISLSDTLNPAYREIKYLAGAYVSKKEGESDKAFQLYEKAYVLRNSILQQNIKNQLFKLDKQYDLTQEEEENAALKISNRNKVIAITLLITVFLIGMFVFINRHNQNKNDKIANDMKNQRLEFELKEKEAANAKKNELLLSKLQNKVENTLLYNRLTIGIASTDKLEEFLQDIKKQSIITESEWKYYKDEIDHIFNNKLAELKKSYPKLTDKDINVITLICLELDISDCCSLLNKTKYDLYHRRNLIKERIGINKDNDLEEWIEGYLNS